MTRVAVCGGDDLSAAVADLGLDIGHDGPEVVVVDLGDEQGVARAALYPASLPRVLVGGDRAARIASALGSDAPVLPSVEPAVLGPAISAAIPKRARGRTRSLLVTSPAGGVGRTLLVANVAARLAGGMQVVVLDATGTGAAGWWLGVSAPPWSDLEGLVGELSTEHLAVVAAEAAAGLRVIGGAPATPSVALITAAVQAARALGELLLIDAPLLVDPLTTALAETADRLVVVCPDQPAAIAVLEASLRTDAWIVAAGSRVARLADREVLRCVPRDDIAVSAAERGPAAVRGALGRAYDELAELTAIDAGR